MLSMFDSIGFIPLVRLVVAYLHAPKHVETSVGFIRSLFWSLLCQRP